MSLSLSFERWCLCGEGEDLCFDERLFLTSGCCSSSTLAACSAFQRLHTQYTPAPMSRQKATSAPLAMRATDVLERAAALSEGAGV